LAMCLHQERACQQRGENEKWREHLPKNIVTKTGRELTLRVLCPGEVALVCEGDLQARVTAVTRLHPDNILLRYFYTPKDLIKAERDLSRQMSVMVGACVEDENVPVSILYIAQPVKDDDGTPPKVEVAFFTDSEFEGQRIARTLFAVAKPAILAMIGPCNVQALTFQRNMGMRRVLETLGFKGEAFPEEQGVMEYIYPLQLAA